MFNSIVIVLEDLCSSEPVTLLGGGVCFDVDCRISILALVVSNRKISISNEQLSFFFQATDGDIGINAAFFYSILSGNSDGSFTIDSVSGALSTTAPLDREKKASYILLVRVSDLHGNQSYGVVNDDSTVVEVIVEVSRSPRETLRDDEF